MNTPTNTAAALQQLPDADALAIDADSPDIGAIADGLPELMQACGDNKHDQVDVLITVLMDHGINLGPQIIAAARRLGFDGQHVGIRLHHGNGDRWRRDPDGTYRTLV